MELKECLNTWWTFYRLNYFSDTIELIFERLINENPDGMFALIMCSFVNYQPADLVAYLIENSSIYELLEKESIKALIADNFKDEDHYKQMKERFLKEVGYFQDYKGTVFYKAPGDENQGLLFS